MNPNDQKNSEPIRFTGMETGPGPELFEHRPENLATTKKPPSVRLRLGKLRSKSPEPTE
ncbi:MAG: hypothetical protein AAF558_14495 [Verrucomicrobiota bacterium]